MNIEELQKSIPAEIPSEISDQIQFFLRSYADQQMRYVIYFCERVNFEVLKKAFWFTICSEPVFSCFYKEESKTAFWKKHDDRENDLLVDLIEVTGDPESKINEFLTGEIQPFSFPIVKAKVFRSVDKDFLCINMNHTPTDGAGLKEFVKLVASNYSSLISDPDYELKPGNRGDRSLRQVTDNFSLLQKLRFTREGFRSPKRGLTWSFDWSKTKENNQRHIIRTKISNSTFVKIKTFGRLHNATINDMILTSFIRSFIGTNSRNKIAFKPVIIPVDLRKYIKQPGNSAICSLTGSLICNIGRETGITFTETLIKVRDEMNKKKEEHAEMNRIMQIVLLSKLMSYSKLKKALMNVKMPPIPLITNVGIINPEEINFNGIAVENAFVTGAISLDDNFCMAYSTFQKEITFSIGFTGSENQVLKVNDFLKAFKSELESIS
jgi:NRPS condensation-like uncharacterized protein